MGRGGARTVSTAGTPGCWGHKRRSGSGLEHLVLSGAKSPHISQTHNCRTHVLSTSFQSANVECLGKTDILI